MKPMHTSIRTALLAASLTAAAANAAVVTLDATADHAGLIQNVPGNTDHYDRADTLWGKADASATRRNGLIEFAPLDSAIQSGIADGSITVQSVTLELWNTNNSWAENTLLFARLNDADADWASLSGPDDGSEGVNSWDFKDEVNDVAWSGTGAFANRGEDFGSLTSSYTTSGSSATGDTKFTVTLSGTELNDWLSNGSIAPNLVVYLDTAAGTNDSQARFATINTADTGDEFAPNLVVAYIPEPGTLALIGLAGLAGLAGLRRRR